MAKIIFLQGTRASDPDKGGMRHYSTGDTADLPKDEATNLIGMGKVVPLGGDAPTVENREAAEAARLAKREAVKVSAAAAKAAEAGAPAPPKVASKYLNSRS